MLRDRPLTPRQWQLGLLGKSTQQALCLVALSVILIQLLLFGRWSALPRLNEGSVGLFDFRDTSVRNGTSLAEGFREDIMQAFREQEQKLSDIAADLNSQLKERESALISLGVRLQEREEELVKWQAKLTEAIASGSVLNARLLNAAEDVPGKSTVPAVSDDSEPVACNRLQDLGKKGKVEWRPAVGKYLLVMCSGGQLSNRLACIRQHILDAALLNRTLIFPSHGVDYDYENLLDLQQPTSCFGNNTFITLDEYLRTKAGSKKTLKVDRLICHVHTYQKPKICNSLKSKFSQLGITFGVTEIPPLRTTGPWFKYRTKDFLASFVYSDDIIAFGNMFGVGGKDLRFEGSGPINVTDSCRYYLTPSRPILQAAAGFVNSFLGTNYMAVHLRRGDFFQHCMRGKAKGRHGGHPCFHPIQQVAQCLVKRLDENPGLHAIYLATNGNEEEVAMLGRLLTLLKKPVPLVRLSPREGAPWAEALIKRKLENDPEVIALVEKTICVLSSVFFGTAGSTFSGDISRLRDWWFLKTCKDGSICGAAEPDTIPIMMR